MLKPAIIRSDLRRKQRRRQIEQSLIFIQFMLLLLSLLQFSITFIVGQPENNRSYDGVEMNEDFLREQLPRLEIDQKKSVKIKCKLNETLENFDFHVVWMRIFKWRWPRKHNVTDFIALNSTMKLRDERFRIFKESPTVYYLTINDLTFQDGAIYMCRAQKIIDPKRKSIKKPRLGLMSGAKLKVLIPMTILEDESSPGIVRVNEYESVLLRCSVGDMYPIHIDWKRQDGEPISRLGANESELDWKSQWSNNTMVDTWKSSRELKFEQVLREHSGVYFCSGVPASTKRREHKQTGVQKRIELIVGNCRQFSDKRSSRESCSMSRILKLEADISEKRSHSVTTTTTAITRISEIELEGVTTTSVAIVDEREKEATTTTSVATVDAEGDTDENMQHFGPNVQYVYVSSSSGSHKRIIDASCPILLAQTIALVLVAIMHSSMSLLSY